MYCLWHNPDMAANQRRRPRVGAQVKQRRREQALTLSQVGELTGLNVGDPSQVENDKALALSRDARRSG